METGHDNTEYKNIPVITYKNTGCKNILAGNVSIGPYVNLTFYKNIPDIRTYGL